MYNLKKMERFLVLCLVCCLALGQLFVAPPADAGGIGVFINGKRLKTDVAPYLQSGRVMVPFRALFEALGATVSWDEDRRAVTGVRNGSEVRLTIDSSTAYVNNAPKALDAPAAIANGSTFVPLRFVGEALGASVQWDSAANAVRITLGAAAAASTPSASAPVSKVISVKDYYGNTALISSPAKRIVAAYQYPAGMIIALGGADSLVGVPSGNYFPPVMQSKTGIGSGYTPSVEKILSLKPDLVITIGSFGAALKNQLNNSGSHVPVLFIDCFKLDHMAYDVNLLGKILGKEQAADTYLNDYYLKYTNLIADRIKDIPLEKRPTVLDYYYAGAAAGTTLSSSGRGSSDDQMITMAGGRNICGDTMGKISDEFVLAKNPQIIIGMTTSGGQPPSGYGQSPSGMKNLVQQIMNRPSWGHISAVKSGKIYIMSGQIYYGPGVPLVLLYEAKCFYPDLFKDVDLTAIHRKWMSDLYGLPYNGAWFYPAP